MKIALIGCGAAARHYYLPALKASLGAADRLYLVDSDRRQAASLAAELGAGKVLTDYREALRSVDGVIVAVPHFLHYSVAMDALRAGVHVLCEKPLAESAREVQALIAEAQAAGAALCVNNTRRLFPSFREAARLIAAGEIGPLRSITYTEGSVFEWQSATGFYVDPRVSSKGVLLDLGAHVLDLVCWWLGRKPDLIGFEDDSFGGPESFASVHASAGGCDVRVLLNRLSGIDSRFEIAGERGVITGRPNEWQRLEVEAGGARRVLRLGPKMRAYPDFVVPVVRNFLRVAAGGAQPLVTGADVHGSIALIEECYRNRRRRRSPALERAAGITPAPERVLVTGAAGFIGARVVELLHLAGDRKVRAGIRRWSTAARLGRFPVDIARLDVLDAASVEKALDGVGVVIHCAKGPGPVNERGTRTVLQAALRGGVRHFVHLSTADVYGEVEGQVDESRPYGHTGTQYNASKIAAEMAVWEYAGLGLPVTIMRPSIVYGPFSTDWSTKLAIKLLAGRGRTYRGLGEGLCNLVFVDDLVRAILRCLDNPAALGQAFNVVGPEVVTWNGYFSRFNRALGLPPLQEVAVSGARNRTRLLQPLRLAGGVVRDHFMAPMRRVAEVSDFARSMMKLAERELKMTPSPEELKLFGRRMLLSGERIGERAGFVPRYGLDEGLQATAQWLGEQGFLGLAEMAGPEGGAARARAKASATAHAVGHVAQL